MKRLVFILIVLCLYLGGCATAKYNLLPQASRTQADWPQIGERTTVNVGDTMLTQGHIDKVTAKALKVPDIVSGVCYKILPGIYTLTGEDDERYYAPSVGKDGYVTHQLGICDPIKNLIIPKDRPGVLCVQTIFGGKVCYDAYFTIADVDIEEEIGAIQYLIYSGVEGKIVKLTYVAAESQNYVSYDLTASNLINCRGARIEVHRYNNEEIEYTVLQNFPERKSMRTE